MTSYCSKILKTYSIAFILFNLIFTSAALSQTNKTTQPPKWQVSHLEDGSTRFEFNHQDQNHHFEFKVIGYEVDGQMKRFEPPKIKRSPGRTTKTWSKELTEHWIQNGNTYWLTLQINNAPVFNENLNLVYEVQSNEHAAISVGGPFTLSFDQGSIDKHISASLSTGGSVFSHLTNMPLFSGTHQLNINTEQKNRTVYFNGLISTQTNVPGLAQTHSELHSIHSTVDTTYITETINVRHFGTNKELVNITRIKNNKATTQELIFKHSNNLCTSDYEPFGYPSSINDDWLLVEGFNDCENSNSENIMLLFQNNSDQWTFHSKININLNIPKKKAILGLEYLIKGKNIYISSHKAVYIYQKIKNLWQYTDMIVFQTQKQLSQIAVNKNWLALGFTDYSEDKKSQGEVRMYKNNGEQWQYHSTLKPSVGHGTDDFGESLSLSNNYLAISAPDLQPKNNQQAKGGIHIFQYALGRWHTKQTIRIPNKPKDNQEIRHFSNLKFDLSGNNLYINDAGVRHKTQTFMDLPEVPEFNDGLGGIHHFKKQGRKWQFIKTIKPNHRFANINQHMATHEGDLYFITTDSDMYNQPTKRLHHYRPSGKTSSTVISPTKPEVTEAAEH